MRTIHTEEIITNIRQMCIEANHMLTPEMQKKMMKIEDCLHCGSCMKKCPYHLNTPELLQKNLKDYKEILAGKKIG